MQRHRRSLSPRTSPGHNSDDGRSYAQHKATIWPPPTNSRVGLSRSLLSSSHPSDSGSQIERWQETAAPQTQDEETGVVGRLFRACLDSLSLFSQLLDAASTPKRERNILRRCHATLKLWADGHGVEHGKLDEVLERSKNLQHMTLCILNPLCKVLLSGLNKHAASRSDDVTIVQLCNSTAEIYGQTRWLLLGFDECASDSDSDSDSDSNSSADTLEHNGIKRIVEDIKTYTDCVLDLSTALDCPAIDPVPDDEPSILRVEQRAAHDYHADLIQAKYPKADADLVKCLGKSSWKRYQRIKQEREANTNAQLHAQSLPASSHATQSKFQDSGLGTSLPAPQTSYAETVISFMTSITGGKRIQIPPLSEEAKKGAKFECNACGRHIQATTNRQWRKHLFLDLQPYTCFYTGCGFSATPFADRQLWSNHLELDHEFGPAWAKVECPLCLELTESGKSAILIHFARHMEDIALAALPRDVESDAESEADTKASSSRTTSSAGSYTELWGYACSPCIKFYLNGEDLGTHLREHHRRCEQDLSSDIAESKTSVTLSPKIIAQLEYLFSIINLSQDRFLREQMDAEGFVPLESIADHKYILENPVPLLDLINFGSLQSSNIEYRSDGGIPRVRRRVGWQDWTITKIHQGASIRDELKSNNISDSTTVEAPPLKPSFGHRTKVFILEKNDWVDMGIGYCLSSAFKDESKLFVLSEENPGKRLLEVDITRDYGFHKQGDTLIVWTESNGTDMALSFQDPEGCAYIWTFIDQTLPPIALSMQGALLEEKADSTDQKTNPHLRPPAKETSRSHWTTSEQNEFHRNVELYGTDWAAIAKAMDTKTPTTLKDHYFQLIEDGDTQLQRLAEEANRRKGKLNDVVLKDELQRVNQELGQESVLIAQLRQGLVELQKGNLTQKNVDEDEELLLRLERTVAAIERRGTADSRVTPDTIARIREDIHRRHLDLEQIKKVIIDLEDKRYQRLRAQHACEDCNSDFTQASDLATHKNSHSQSSADQHGCPEIANFATFGSLPGPEWLLSSTKELQPTQLPSVGQSPDNPLPSTPFEDEESALKCICGFADDDGNTVLCEKCDTWQHIICYYESSRDVPDVHECLDCLPRPISTKLATEKQLQQRYERGFLLPAPRGKSIAPDAGSQPNSRLNHTSYSWVSTEPGSKVNSSRQPGIASDDETVHPASANQSIIYTRNGHISKAKKGLKVHVCECGKSFTRAEHLRRHQMTKNHNVICNFPKCNKQFTSLDILRRHKVQQHQPAPTDTEISSKSPALFDDQRARRALSSDLPRAGVKENESKFKHYSVPVSLLPPSDLEEAG